MKKTLFVLCLIITACSPVKPEEINTEPFPTQGSIQTEDQTFPTPNQEVTVKFEITSPAFKNGEPIPTDYSCDGRDMSPALTWSEPPAGTQSFALIMDDPDAPSGTWVHWVMFNIPASARGLPENIPTDPQLSDGSLQGRTSAGRSGYHGPCPPSGIHRYFFKLYALDTILSLPASANKEKVLAAMESHILANAELMGTFSR
jgi:Raf kinase inhibitor-like YbhB/YbcL family protein